MIEPPKSTAPTAAAPGPGSSSRSRALHGLWVTCSTTPPSAGTPAGAVQRCPALTPFSRNAAVSVSQALSRRGCVCADCQFVGEAVAVWISVETKALLGLHPMMMIHGVVGELANGHDRACLVIGKDD